MLKLSQPITSINGFKIGDKVRLKDGDGGGFGERHTCVIIDEQLEEC